jgi:ribose-phosphate pyrophosphokinase
MPYCPIYLKKIKGEIVVVSPDAGVLKGPVNLANGSMLLSLLSIRGAKKQCLQVMHVIGDVKKKTAILLDDRIYGGTIVQAVEAITEDGQKLSTPVAHIPCFQGALERINNSSLVEMVATNTIPLSDEAQKSKK